MKLYPLKFRPIYKEKIWGGDRLREILGRDIPRGKKIGESWEIADHGADVSIVSEGHLAGSSLRDIMTEHPRELLGEEISKRGLDRFPLLLKLIDASDKLSVQVHPPDAYAAEKEKGERGKTEMWYVMYAREGAELICGLKKNVSKVEFENCLYDGELERCLVSEKVSRGDVIFIPSGRVHAICAGNLILEIQENSDVTYRVYDWNRLGADGKPRPLHVEKALDVINFQDTSRAAVEKHWEERDGYSMTGLIECDFFSTEQVKIDREWVSVCDGRRFRIISVVDGSAGLYYGDKRELIRVVKGDNILLPAAVGEYRLTAEGNSCNLLSTEIV
jgi:mannose-6-phosphate isomerase